MHISAIFALVILAFLRQTLFSCTRDVKEAAYKELKIHFFKNTCEKPQPERNHHQESSVTKSPWIEEIEANPQYLKSW